MPSFITRSLSAVRRFFSRTWTYAKAHKVVSAIVILVVLGGGYYVHAKDSAAATTTQYVLAAAANAPIESTVTASGEVSANHQLDLSPKSSGEVTGVYVQAGDTVKAGQLLVSIDDTDAEKTLRDAKLSLESAQISYTQSITSEQNSTSNNTTSLSTASGNGFDAAASTQTDITSILPGIDTILNGNSDVQTVGGGSFSNTYVNIIKGQAPNAAQLQSQARTSLDAAQASAAQTTALYQAASRTSSPTDILALLQSMQDTAAKTDQAVKDASAFLNLVNETVTNHDLLEVPPSLSSQITTLSSDTSKADSDTSSITSAISSVTNAQQDVSSDAQSISGGTPLDVQSAELSLAKAKESVTDAEDDLADYAVTAPFDGTIAQVDVQKFDQASGKVLTLITTQQYADISLNETDISKVRAGQKAELTFDAIDGLTIDGTVAEVDQIGTVSQGVSTYTVKIGFDTQDARVLPGMTVNATIITASKDSALVVPSSAVKTTTLNGQTSYYVEVATASSSAAMKGTGTTGTRTASSTRAYSGAGRTSGAGAASSTGFAGFAGRTGSSTASSTRSFGAAGGASRTTTVATTDVTIRRVPVTIGIQGDTTTEITSGLTPGQLVVSQSLNASGTTTKASSGGLFGLFGSKTTTGTAARATTGAGAAAGGARAGFGAGGGGAAAGGFGGGAGGFSGRSG